MTSDPDSVSLVLAQIDHAIQFGEDAEPQEPQDQAEEPEPEDAAA